MKFLPDETIRHLREAADLPDLSGTKYEVVDFVSRGGMGAVYLARDRELDREVALKVLSVQDHRGETAARMIREAKILAHLEHPGIVPIHDVGTLPDGRVYYTMKFVRGRRLDELVKGESVNLSDALRIFGRVCEAVAFAHSHGVIHRDLKPQNIMVGAFGEVLVMDWGVAKVLAQEPDGETDAACARHAAAVVPDAYVRPGRDGPPDTDIAPVRTGAGAAPGAPGHTEPGTVLGTPGYMAPEQERGNTKSIDRRSDVFALGAILRDLAAGAGDAPAPKRLAAISKKAMAERPEDRYQSADLLGVDIARYIAGLAISAYPEDLWDRTRRMISRNRVPIGLILAYLLMRVLLFIITRH
jgi:serine/threonine-protein kinase